MPSRHLGAFSLVPQNGAEDIKKHKWFTTGTEASYWEDMLAKKITPPIKPDVGADDDTGNFECVPHPRPVVRPPRAPLRAPCPASIPRAPHTRILASCEEPTPTATSLATSPPPNPRSLSPIPPPPPFRPPLGRKYPDSSEGSNSKIDARDQELFNDF